MSDKNVYDYEMLKKRFSDRDVERVLTGRKPESHELARLAPVLEAFHAAHPSAPSETSVTRFATEAAEITRSTAPGQPDTPTHEDPSPARRLVRIRRRVLVLATATLTFAAMTGVAFAADTAAPGDPLYGIDRALEQIGINDGGAAERLTEAQTLAERGEIAEAMRHVAELVEDTGNDDGPEGRSNAADALRNAADQVQTTGDDSSESVRAAVAAMLSEMADMSADPEITGADFGVRVSEMARLMSGNGPDDASPAPEDIGPPENPGPTDDLEPAGDVGPPEDKEAPTNQGKSGDQDTPPGQADDQGPPEDRAQPENPGKSSSGGRP